MQCCVPNCPANVIPGEDRKYFPHHRFPGDTKMRARWLNALGLPQDFVIKSAYRVCGRHFSKEWKHNKRLKHGAVPAPFCYASQNKKEPDPASSSLCEYLENDSDLYMELNNGYSPTQSQSIGCDCDEDKKMHLQPTLPPLSRTPSMPQLVVSHTTDTKSVRSGECNQSSLPPVSPSTLPTPPSPATGKRKRAASIVFKS